MPRRRASRSEAATAMEARLIGLATVFLRVPYDHTRDRLWQPTAVDVRRAVLAILNDSTYCDVARLPSPPGGFVVLLSGSNPATALVRALDGAASLRGDACVRDDSLKLRSCAVGTLIGHGGANLHLIKVSTGCHIEVSRRKNDARLRTVHLCGSEGAVRSAMKLCKVLCGAGDHRRCPQEEASGEPLWVEADFPALSSFGRGESDEVVEPKILRYLMWAHWVLLRVRFSCMVAVRDCVERAAAVGC